MSDKEKFEGFKQKMIDDNEKQYGAEARGKYGNQAVDAANMKIKNWTEEQRTAVERLSIAVNEAIRTAFEKGDPASDLARKACELHKQWLQNFWKDYSPAAHLALAQMYVDDERFTAYYNQIAPGCAVFLLEAMKAYTGIR